MSTAEVQKMNIDDFVRVKFYSKDDMSAGYNLIEAKKRIDSFDINRKDYEIDDIIEFYNIIRYIEEKCFIKTWNDEDIKNINNITKEYKKIISCFMNEINDDNIIDIFNSIEDYNYRDDFFELFENYKKYEIISEQIFNKLLHVPKLYFPDILCNERTTYRYGNLIKQYFFEDFENAEIILDNYAVKHINNRKKVYFPQELTLDDKENIIKNYIDSKNPNLNFLRIINNIQNDKELKISDKTRKASLKKTEEENNKYFCNNSGIEYGVGVCFTKDQKNAVEFVKKDNIQEYSYDLNWIQNNTDFSTLLNNFIYLFNYVDKQMRIELVSKENELGLTEKFLGIRSKKEYSVGISFNVKNMLSTLQIVQYYNLLEKMNIRLEEIIEWFFKLYALEEFNISNYEVTMPSKDSTYFEKCKVILPEIDYILKQYKLLVEEGEIDQELLVVSSAPILFKDVKSLINKKYIYGNTDSKEFNSLCYHFFSDQCMLHYTKKYGTKYNNFYKLIISEDVKIDDYQDYLKPVFEWLINGEYIFIDTNGYIKIKDNILLTIIMDLNYNEVISYWKYPKKYRKKMDELIDNQILLTESTLFSRQEQDYFNYHLNQRSFNNSLDLRNRYLHGNKFTDNENYNNYMIFLKILILIILKINDEFCTNYDLNNNAENIEKKTEN
jgi:hypothetical protein